MKLLKQQSRRPTKKVELSDRLYVYNGKKAGISPFRKLFCREKLGFENKWSIILTIS